ncbi:MAG: DUF992 domain-containing protein [Xanthobacteraceae bacterium]|nr:DUF992 domain-containing protein [Xanthobacteraceae bacterium]MBX3522237.1 DUF992 domain-containing protein [Xanthobacteraceae bacterium]MBX3534279.1 DUF992 domain-containing protein [Xanthobacteraceae bacterium]MBX3549146.1 DUF992 domain-containing protein [Xanthobacteraceae bacterium]MCW5675287.1 DUF992 domain-containing protein [Xanthobacteraceae bacterium]
MNRRLFALVAGVAAIFAFASSPASAQHFERVGTLECKVAPNVSFVVGSHRTAGCFFYPTNSRRAHRYRADIGRIGLDLNISGGGVLVWAVHAHNKRLYPGDLRGTYTGASGNIALGLGVGGNVLVGGSHNTVALQPLSGEGNIGVGLSVGVGQLVLN